MNDEIKQNIKEKSTWLRGLYMLLFMIFYGVAEVIIFTVVVFQFVLSLLTRKTNERLLTLGQSLSTYQYQVLIFLTFNSEEHPYPFGAWPAGKPTTATTKTATKKKATTKKIAKEEPKEENGKS
ncbi:MAG: DUF4389 domain-containing protein [Gammaproteobacteria bacterium]|nr:DUF4389 domain-containing protein [Gammaproteobacteria bacterium]MCW8988063.1 DUF4389 domain-containing protein [Gammaproteobacteria bacterium]